MSGQGQAILSNVFDVAGHAVIDGVADVVEAAIVMPAGVTVAVEGLANNGASDVGVAIESEVGAWCIKCRGKLSRRSDGNRLRA